MSTRPRIGLIGAGSMGRNHARIIAQSSRAEFSVIIDPLEESGAPLAVEHDTQWSPTIDAIADVDAVIVSASTEHHYRIAKDVIAAGRPLLIEKPVCPSLEQTTEILQLSEAAGTPIMCGFLERYNPAVMVARRMIDDPLYVRAERHSPYAPRIKTGVAWDLLVHDVDLITQIFGGSEPDAINVEVGHFHPSSAPDAEDVVDVSLRFAEQGLASASASRLGQRKVRSLVVQTLDDMIEVDLLRRGVTLFRHTTIDADRPGGSGFRQVTEMEVPEITGREPLATQFDRFLDLIAGDVDPDIERHSILPAHRIVDAALATKR
ncbi:Gfo/Idh/MocA family protein [Microbacterium immunditiarum]|uniref:Putative dehydrogenase n=1 Tax=Microbacterium immunditiarum TaxID=337480 RepID=A0A7Y9GQZ8_9MICO|nr:Gfo/Idh/MocA family oxidoreductase [Microbacterium immunditiarum]NYE21028.1 putative dehydrogenase [Microbacterium immunditiarum]